MRPIIVVPPALLDDPTLLRAALLHELAHIRRLDVAARFIQIIAASLLWWWPVVRLINKRLELAREAACDAWALEASDVPRAAYARLLVRMASLHIGGRTRTRRALLARCTRRRRPRSASACASRLDPTRRAPRVGAARARRCTQRRRTSHGEACHYTPQLGIALYESYPQADLDGDGLLSRSEACDLQAELRRDRQELSSRLTPEADEELQSLLTEPLCCNCAADTTVLPERSRNRAMKACTLLLAALTLAACQNDTKNLNDKIDKLDKKLDALIAQGGRGGNNAGAQQQRPSRPEPDRAKTYAVSVEGDPFDGPADAKVTVVKAYDYACPYCERVRPTMAELHKKYGEDLRIVYKQLVVHPQTAMTRCARILRGRQAGQGDADGRANLGEGLQGSPVRHRPVLDERQLREGQRDGEELKLDIGKFKEDMKACQTLVQNDMRELQKFGVGATPAFFVNGRYLVGRNADRQLRHRSSTRS